MDIQIIHARPTSAAQGLAVALERNRCKAAASPQRAQPQAKTAPAPAKAAAPTFTGPKARAKALHYAVTNDPACKGKAQAALVLLCDDELAAVGPAGLVKLLRQSPANMVLPTGASPRDGWAQAAAHVNWVRGQAEAPSRLEGSNHGWDKIHAKLRAERGN